MRKSYLVACVLCVAGLVTVAVVACGGSGNGGGGSAGGNGELEIATYLYVREPMTDWDPAIESCDGGIVLNNVYETLLRYEPDSDSFTPILATEYESTDDGMEWTFHLREGVKFHDGTDFNAEAVKFTVERCIEVNKGVSYIWAPVKEIETPDEYTVVFELKFPAPMDLVVASQLGAYIVSPTAAKSNPDDWFTQGHEAGTGPYKLKSWKQDQQVVLEKFPEYWGGWDGKHFDTCIIQKVAEPATRRQMIEAGEADITSEMPVEDYRALEDNAAVDVVTFPSFRNVFVAMNTKKEPTDNELVRQALSYLFPYEEVVDYAFGGYGVQAQGPIPTGMWGHSDQVEQYTYDPAKAKDLLAQAGYPNGGFKLVGVYTSGDELKKKCLEFFKSELEKVNIELELRGAPFASIWEQAKKKDPPQHLFAMHWYPTYCDPYDWLYNLYRTEDPTLYNLAYWSNEGFDTTIDEATAVSATDRATATAMYVEAQQTAMEAAPYVCVLDAQWVAVVNKTFKGFKANPAYQDVVFFYDCHRE